MNISCRNYCSCDTFQKIKKNTRYFYCETPIQMLLSESTVSIQLNPLMNVIMKSDASRLKLTAGIYQLYQVYFFKCTRRNAQVYLNAKYQSRKKQ